MKRTLCTDISCRQLTKLKCKSPKCNYAMGKKRSFCRLSKNAKKIKCQKLQKSNCNPPKCFYATGDKRRFCRTSKNRKTLFKIANNSSRKYPSNIDNDSFAL